VSNGLPYVSTNEINTFCNRYVRPNIIDQRYQSRSLLGILNSAGRIVRIDGGSIISQPILAQPNQTASSYFGADLLNADAQEEFTNVEIRWCGAYASATVNGTDKLRCTGRTATLNIVKAKVESAYMACFDKVGSFTYGNGNGNGGKDWDGFGAGINNAAGFQVYNGIDRVANPWWQSQVFDPGTPTALSTASMMTLFTACQTDEERVQLITCTKTGYASYWALLTPQERFLDDSIGNLGFNNISFQGCALVQDYGCPAYTMYFVNLDHCRLILHSQREFEWQGFQRPFNQDTEAGQVLAMGNFENRKCSASGVMRNISNG
jgi:hypothetical protein